MKIINTATGGTAYTSTNAPGFTEDNPAKAPQLEAHAEVMNVRAKNLGIKARYEVAS